MGTRALDTESAPLSVSQAQPLAPPAPPPPPTPAQLRREQVSGGSLWYGQLRRALPRYIDDLTADFGDDLFDRLIMDAQIAACVTIVKAGILEEGVTLAPAIEDKTDPSYDQAVDITEAAEAMLGDLTTPLDDVLWDMLNGVAFGNKVAEQVYEYGPDPKGSTILRLSALKVKPRRAVAFVVDQYLNVLGLLGLRPGSLYGPGTSTVVDPSEIIPREKFAVFSFRPKDGDPRGTSVLRPAYDPWWRKRQIMVEYVKYLAQFAGPSLIGFTAETASDGVDASGLPKTAEELMLEALLAFQGGTATVFGPGSIVQPVEMQGNGVAFLSAISQCNAEITKAILTQSLATEEGEHQARAAAQVHQDVLDTLVRQGKRSLLRMIGRDVLRTWVRYNWGEDAVPLTPVPTLGTTERKDVPALMTAVAALQRSGYTHPSQFAEIDQLLGLGARDLSVVDPATPAVVDPNAAPAADPMMDPAAHPNPDPGASPNPDPGAQP